MFECNFISPHVLAVAVGLLPWSTRAETTAEVSDDDDDDDDIMFISSLKHPL